MNPPVPPRSYRFGPLDRSGILLGLSAGQCAVLGGGALLAGWLLDRHAAPFVVAPLVAALVVAFGRVGGEPLVDLLPVAGRYALRAACGRNRWYARLPHAGRGQRAEPASPDLPAFLAGLVLVDAGPATSHPDRLAGVGVVADRRARTVSAVMRVHANGFVLARRGDQERLVAGWGDVLGGFCREGGPVASVRWTEWMAPASLEACESWADTHALGDDEILAEYRQVLADVGAVTTGHEVLVTVTVDERRLGGRSHRSVAGRAAAIDVLLEEMRLLAGRLDAAGLSAEPPLSAAELADVIRHRFDPGGTPADGTAPSLARAAGLVPTHRYAPLGTEVAWSHVRVDASVHRTLWIAEWPRLEVGPNWIEPLLLHPGAARTVSVIYEPVPPGRSRRDVDREATKLASDGEQRNRSGFRIGARHRRQEGALAEREAELVAGYGELCFSGFVTMSAADPAELDRACAEYLQAGAQAGVELRRLDGRHHLGLLCTLPIGRGLARRRTP